MKYIKSINESIYRLFGKKTKELLTHFGITEKEYQSYIDIIDKCGYSEIKSKIPFYMDLVVGMSKIKHIISSISWDYNDGNDILRIRLKVIQ